MSDRNVIKQSEVGKKAMPMRLGMTMGEMRQLMNIARGKENLTLALWDVGVTAFYFGYAVAMRHIQKEAQINGKKEKE